MDKIYSSASKSVFVGVALTVCVAFLFEIGAGKITLDPKDFLALASMAFTFYFTRDKGELVPNTSQITTTKIETPPQGQDTV